MLTDVIVVGGGIAGLSVAYELQRRHLSFALLERQDRAGGVVLSEHIDGYTIDAGPDALLVQKPDGIALCRELGLAEQLVPTQPPRVAYIQRAGRLHPLPAASVLGIPTRVGPFLRTGLFTWAGKLRMAGEWFVPPRRDQDDESIGQFITRRFGTEATTYLAEPLLAGINAGDVNKLSVLSLFPRFVETERSHGSLLRAFRRVPRSSSGDGAFRSLPGGLSQLICALVDALPRDSVRLGVQVRRLERHAGSSSWGVETTDGQPCEARAVVLATPAYATGELVRPIDTQLADACAGIPYASTGTVVMAFRRADVAHPLNGSGFVVPRVEASGILAATWMSSKWPHRAPADRVLMRTFVGGARDPQALDHSDEELIDRSLRALRGLLGISGQPLLTRVYRWNRASAQHEVGHLARLEQIERRLSGHPGVFVTGSGFRGVGIPDCVTDGRRTAGHVAEYLKGERP